MSHNILLLPKCQISFIVMWNVDNNWSATDILNEPGLDDLKIRISMCEVKNDIPNAKI